MIKSLLDADENPPPETKVIIEETIIEPPSFANTVFTPEQTADAEDILEIPSTFRDARTNAEIAATPIDKTDSQIATETFAEQSNAPRETAQTNSETAMFQTAFKPESTAETMRKSGLAYAAAITLFGAVVFMMILGWGADLLFGSSPWGIVGGIVLGATIGFVQLFRLSSQIIKNK